MRVAFIFNEFSLHNEIITDYLAVRPGDQAALLKVPLVLKGKNRIATGRKILPQLPVGFILEKLHELIAVGAITLSPKLLRRGAVFRRLRSIASRHQLPYLVSDNVAGDESLAFLSGFKPDMIVTLMHQIVKGELLRIAPRGILNIHPGMLPEFRGIQPYLWELSEGSSHAGPSIHFIENEEVDAGAIAAFSRYPIIAGMSVSLNYYLTARCASRLLPQVIAAIEAGTLAPVPQQREGSYFRWPDKKALRRLRERGHRLSSLHDLFAITTGRYHDFRPEVEVVHTATGA